jgi:hypothetical protein
MTVLPSILELVTPGTAGRRLTRLSAFTLWRFFYPQFSWIPPRQPLPYTLHTPPADAPTPAASLKARLKFQMAARGFSSTQDFAAASRVNNP